MCHYTKINDNAYVDGEIVKVIIKGDTYKTCALCHEFYKVDGHNTKYCPNCRKRANIIRTSERNKKSKQDYLCLTNTE